MVLLFQGAKCSYEECEKPATVIAQGRDRTSWEGVPIGHPKIALYCEPHGRMVAEEGHPEYDECCPNCGCLFGVN